ncbi:MAG: hypothetical protein ACK4FB_14370 [Brevundimonas sp.]|uniref:hypothetical protein n=1 Tax=Brevundimonas sp. TaxID=1871086 RepID=UPI00391989E0
MAEREEPDEQDQSETFDETHLDDEGDGEITLEEMDVLDVTQEAGDADDEDLELEDVQALDGVDPRADARTDGGEQPLNELDAESDGDYSADEIELVPSGLMRNVKGAQGSAAHWESRRLDDDDIDSLGYGPDEEPQKEA